MIYILIPLIFVSFLSVVLGILSSLFLKKYSYFKYYFFALVCTGLWPLFVALFYIFPHDKIFFAYIHYIIVLFIPVFLIQFVVTWKNSLSGKKGTNNTLYIFLLINLILGIFIAIPNFSFVYEVAYNVVHFNFSFVIYSLYFIILMVYFGYRLLLFYIDQKGILRQQVQYIMLSVIPVSTTGIIFDIVLPFMGNYKYIYIGPLGLSLSLVLFYIVIQRYSFWGKAVVIKAIMQYILLSLVTYVLFYSVTLLETSLFHSVFAVGSYILGIALSLMFVFLFIEISHISDYSLKIDNELNDFEDYLLVEVDINKVTNAIKEVLKKSFEVDSVDVYLNQNQSIGVGDNLEAFSLLISRFGGILFLEQIFYKSKALGLSWDEINLVSRLMESGYAVVLKSKEVEIYIHTKKDLNPFSTEEEILLRRISKYLFITFQKLDLIGGLQDRINQAVSELERKNKDLEKANEEMKGVDKMKDDLLSIASHELRTPASIVKGNIYMAKSSIDKLKISDKKDKDEIDKLERYISRSVESIENEIRIVNTLLEASRLGKEDMSIFPEYIDLDAMIASQIDAFKKDADAKGVQLKQIVGHVGMSVGDKTKIEEVIGNLITNAIKYSEHGIIEVSTEKNDKEVIVHVKDHGVGIKEEDIATLFQKFHRLHNYTGDPNDPQHLLVRPGGTGLGLYVVKGIIERHGGRVWVNSKIGEGSTFSFSLPNRNLESSNDDTVSKDMFKVLGLRK